MEIMMCRIFLTVLFVAVAMGDEWIDPFSMDLDRPEELNALDSSQYHVTLAHYKRSLNLLLNALIFDERTDGYVGKITVDLSKADYDFVKEFAMGESPVTDFNKLDAILTQVYTRSIIDDLSDFYLSWSEYFLFVVTSQSFLMSLFVVLSSSIAYRIWKARLSLKEIMKCIFFVMWVIDFIYHYFKLVQQNEIEKMVNSMKFKSIPAECNPSELSTFSYVRTKMLGDKTCEEFMKAKYSDIYLNVNPLKILATQFGDFIKTPAPAIGESLGLMTSSFMGNLSWFQMLLVPVVFYFAIMFVCTIVSLITGKSFALKSLLFSFHSEGTKAVKDETSLRPQIVEVKFPELENEESMMLKQKKSAKNKGKAIKGKESEEKSAKNKRKAIKGNEDEEKVVKSIERKDERTVVEQVKKRSSTEQGAGDGIVDGFMY